MEALRSIPVYVVVFIGKCRFANHIYSSTGNRRFYAYGDSDFGADETRKNCSGYVFVLANGPIRWKFSFSKEAAMSTCEAEVRAVSAMLKPTNTAIWIDKVLECLGLGEQYVEGVVEIKSSIDVTPLTPMDIMEDNQAGKVIVC